MMTTTKKRRRMSYSLDASVANVVANATAVIAERLLRQRRQQSRRRMRNQGGSAPGRTFRRRYRRSVQVIYEELGDVYFRWAYRLKYSTFMSLATELRLYIIAASHQKGTAWYVPNGRTSPDVWLACSTRWFAGGSTYDIMTTYGIGHCDTINSCWYVLDAINRHPRHDIAYPADHNKQRSIAEGSYDVSSAAGFGCCAGVVDGILIWIHTPSQRIAW